MSAPRSPAARPTVVQFGAGRIGRGFTGHLWSEAGYEVVFADVVPEMLAALNERRQYPLRLVGPDRYAELTLGPVRAVDGRDPEAVGAELARAAFACTAVGVRALPGVAAALAAGLLRRPAAAGPLNVFLCENQLRASRSLRAALPRGARRGLGLVDTVVLRIAPVVPEALLAREPLLVLADDWPRLVADRGAVLGEPPPVAGIEFVPDYEVRARQKLWVYLMAHALAAYRGYLRGCAYLHEAAGDPEIAAVLRAALGEGEAALRRRYGADLPPLPDLARRFANAALGDTVARVGADPWRKLGRDDRLLGAARLCLAQGIVPAAIVTGIAGALRFDPPGDPTAGQLQALLRAGGLDAVFREVCGISPRGRLARLIRGAVSAG